MNTQNVTKAKTKISLASLSSSLKTLSLTQHSPTVRCCSSNIDRTAILTADPGSPYLVSSVHHLEVLDLPLRKLRKSVFIEILDRL